MTQVSVLMPTFAQAHFIARAIESLYAQHLTGWELIIIDDATPQIVTPYRRDERIRYYRLEHNHG